MITRGRWLRLVAAPVALLLWLPACAAPAACSSRPAPYALIFGTVWGPGEHPLYGVHVKLRRAAEKKFRWQALSDHRGEFAIRVPAGRSDYVLIPDVKARRIIHRFRKPGFTWRATSVSIPACPPRQVVESQAANPTGGGTVRRRLLLAGAAVLLLSATLCAQLFGGKKERCFRAPQFNRRRFR
jgi:hypothetical protein